MKRKLVGLVLVVMACLVLCSARSSAAAPPGSVPERSHVCMMQDTVLPSPGLSIEHEEKTYYGCCPMCQGKMLSDPERYMKATDPVTGKRVDKATAPLLEYQGSVLYFETNASRGLFERDPARYPSAVNRTVE